MPARFRERLGAGFYLTIAEPDRCLALYTTAAWDEFCERLRAAPKKDAQYRAYVRHIFGNTEEAQCDPQGRLAIPPHLRAYAAIKKDVVSVGTLTRIEIWAKENFKDGTGTPLGDDVARFVTELGLY